MKRLVAAIATACLCTAAQAQTGKVVKILVGFPPGQATDLVARILAERLGPALGETVIVENRPGQGGSVALAALAKSPPDGATMMLSALASLVANPHLYKSVGYDTLRDFEPVALVADLPLLLVVHPSVPAKTLSELIAYAKANPDKLTHSSSGNGTLSHLGMEDLKRRAGITILHVPYQGSARAMTDLIGGAVTVGLDTVAVTQPHIQSGKMRLLAASTANRLPAFPDTPTIAEQGFPGFSFSAWLGLLYPAGTPKDLVEKTSAALAKIVQSPEVEQKYAALGAVPRYAPPAEFRAFLKDEYQRWGAIVKASGAKVD
ncbi:MAG TPA: tripartite tricarboxylate transporter substrate binding protein [Burkholderiales bacterium]|nr:tripartite tricarboxylate transporter substrate binding protein [Burkholderiales bacterium]